MVLLKMAWLNIWRNPKRTVILLCSVITGLVGVLFLMAFMNSWIVSMKNKAVHTYAGHIKILAKGYIENPVIERHFQNTPAIRNWLETDKRITASAERLAVQGLISSAHRSTTIRIVGIDPSDEKTVSNIAKHVQEGSFLDQDRRNQILVGKSLAKKFKVKLKSRLVLLSQQLGGEIGSGAYKVAGFYDTGSSGFDESTVYILKSDAQKMLNLENGITEIVTILNNMEQSDAVGKDACELLKDEIEIEVLTWKRILPFIAKNIEFSDKSMIVVYAVFYMAMAFGIVNTLLMSIYERTYEFGIMMAIGTRRRFITSMIIIESALIAALATALGVIIGIILVNIFKIKGIDLSNFAEAMEYVQLENILYPYLTLKNIYSAATSAFLVAVLFSIYPAIRASRMKPVEALRETG